MNYFDVFLLSFIEGLTEFLPVSSTGHLIIASHYMGYENNNFVTQFNIIIQFGAILSVLVLYWKRFLPNMNFYKKLFIAFLPAAIIGLAIKSKIDSLLESVNVVAWALIVGGVLLILIEKIGSREKKYKTTDDLSMSDLLKLGFFQCIAFIPGVSRSGATITGGFLLGMTKKEAAEFSFFLAVPTLTGASLIKTLKILPQLHGDNLGFLLTGIILSFIFAYASIRFFIHLVSRTGFLWFGVYRIVLGILILLQFH